MKEVALITGASSGIGKELAFLHAQRKKDLFLVARREDRLLDLKTTLENHYQVKVEIFALDLATPDAAQLLYDHINQNNIQISYLINNAGIGGVGEFKDQSLSQITNMIHLNVSTLTALTRLFIPDLISQGYGRIMNISSIASIMPGPLQAVYYATKAYVSSLSEALYQELKGTPVTVTNILPGATETEFGQVSGMDKTSIFDRPASAKQVAEQSYAAMMAGHLQCYPELGIVERFKLWLIPLLPKKFVLKQVYDVQQVKET